jgi:hypothetical protein
MNITPLAECGSCFRAVPPWNRHILRSAPTAGGVFLLFKCPWCGNHGRIFLGAAEAKRRATEMEMAEQDRELREFIGREVKGMAVDLEGVTSVVDMLLFWEDQERFSPWTIIKEGVR